MKKQTLFVEVPVTRSKSFGQKPTIDAALEKELSKEILDKPDYELHNSSFNIDIEQDASANPWDAAHQTMQRLKKDKHEVSFVEPDIAQSLFDYKKRADDKEENHISKAGGFFSPVQYLDRWPQPTDLAKGEKFVWHLHDNYSQLGSARDYLKQKYPNRKIVLGHIDTGIQSSHPAMPPNFKMGRNFIEGAENNDAEDRDVKFELSVQGIASFIQEQPGHGMATLAIMAGGDLTNEQTHNQFQGTFGAIPQADIYSYRICDTVALFGTRAFAKAVHQAVDDGCQVVTMSMGGGPSRRWAKAVNHAYMNGLTLVTAAGNSWVKGSPLMTRLPKRLIYPARWERVIAATGVTAANTPYLYDLIPTAKAAGGHYMQGNYGPQDLMGTAVSAYTPNTTWLTTNDMDKGFCFSYMGGGTSSATPQVAATAGLWILAHQEELKAKGWNGTWKQVEAVRKAIFSTAKKPAEYMEYLGNGIIQAKDALDYFPKEEELRKSKEASVKFTGLFETLKSLAEGFISKNATFGYQPDPEMLMLELVQLIHSNPDLGHLLEHDLDDLNMKDGLSKNEISKIKEIVIGSKEASQTLKNSIKDF